uniref:Uncharacterized protein n=1 Tax=Globodera rostochiensis TaxID=31243 RepID=A0A914HC74_GLORO
MTFRSWKKEFGLPFKSKYSDREKLENHPTFADNDTSEHPMASSDDTLWAWNLAKKKRTEVEQSGNN